MEWHWHKTESDPLKGENYHKEYILTDEAYLLATKHQTEKNNLLKAMKLEWNCSLKSKYKKKKSLCKIRSVLEINM